MGPAPIAAGPIRAVDKLLSVQRRAERLALAEIPPQPRQPSGTICLPHPEPDNELRRRHDLQRRDRRPSLDVA